jgi:hypothetical protein
MNRDIQPIKKKGNKTKELTPVEFGKIEALLRLNLFTFKEIGEKVGRSDNSVCRVAKKLGIEPLGQAKRTDEWKLKTAELVGNVASKMFESLNNLDEKEMKKISPQGKALIGGIAVDKVMVLTKPKEDPNAQAQIVNMTWMNLVQSSLAPRAKDGPPTIAVNPMLNPTESATVEDAVVVNKDEEKNDGEKRTD